MRRAGALAVAAMAGILAMSSNQAPASATTWQGETLGSISQPNIGLITAERPHPDRNRPGFRPSHKRLGKAIKWGMPDWGSPRGRRHSAENGRERGWQNERKFMKGLRGAFGRPGPGRNHRPDRSIDDSGPITIEVPSDGSQRIVRDFEF
ncbi:hypothetical protein [Streptosporangium fragile]|uniref:hypothetical protein n=1 Tax=Streptosporangium fragile TaxID=46186 RepID=UPI0031E79D45